MDESHNRNFEPSWPSPFASTTPTVRSWAVAAFSHLTPAACGEAVEIAIASAFRMYARLLALGKSDLIYPQVLARYGVVQANRTNACHQDEAVHSCAAETAKEPDPIACRTDACGRVHSLLAVL